MHSFFIATFFCIEVEQIKFKKCSKRRKKSLQIDFLSTTTTKQGILILNDFDNEIKASSKTMISLSPHKPITFENFNVD